MRAPRFRQHILTLAAVGLLAGTVMVTASSSASARALKVPASAAGSYTYNDSVGDTLEGLVLGTDGTVTFSSGCTGLWVQSGKIFSMDINDNCSESTWIFSGVVGPKGLSSSKKPGALTLDNPSGFDGGTWYATKGAPESPASGPMATGAAPALRTPHVTSAVGNYGFYDEAGDSNLPLTLSSDGTLSLSGTCSGLWVQSGKDIAFDLNTDACSLFVMASPVSAKGLGTAKKPGQIEYGEGVETFYAVKT
jgi:hypothetical protein